MDSIEPPSGNQQPEQSPAGESIYVKLKKIKGKEECKLTMKMSSAQAGLAGLIMILRQYSVITRYPMIKVLILLRLAMEREEEIWQKEEEPHD